METTFWKLQVFIGISWLGMSLLSSFSLTPIWSFWRVFFPPWLGCALITGWEGDYSGPGEDSDSGSGEDFPETRFLWIPILHYELSHLNSQTLMLMHLSNTMITWPTVSSHFLLEFEMAQAKCWRVRYVFVAYNQCWNGRCYCNFSLLLHFSPQQISGGENTGNDYWYGPPRLYVQCADWDFCSLFCSQEHTSCLI